MFDVKKIFLFFLFLSVSVPAWGQREELDKANELNLQVVSYFADKDYAKALPLAKEVLHLREKVHGPEDPALISSVNNLASIYEALDAESMARELYKRSLRIASTHFEQDHPTVVMLKTKLGLAKNREKKKDLPAPASRSKTKKVDRTKPPVSKPAQPEPKKTASPKPKPAPAKPKTAHTTKPKPETAEKIAAKPKPPKPAPARISTRTPPVPAEDDQPDTTSMNDAERISPPNEARTGTPQETSPPESRSSEGQSVTSGQKKPLSAPQEPQPESNGTSSQASTPAAENGQ